MLTLIWNHFLYQPVFNALILLYNSVAGLNMGWAVIYLTIGLRFLLLPLTIISERNSIRQAKASAEADTAILAYKGDRIKQKEVARAVMRKYKISPWAKVLSLGIQLLVLILLYQVFIRGISGERLAKILYEGVDLPGKINVIFYGFDIGARHDLLWAGIVAAYLAGSIYLEKRRQKKRWEKPDVFYLFAFPAFTFLALWYLPMVKSLFILTTMLFSDIIKGVRMLVVYFFKSKPAGH